MSIILAILNEKGGVGKTTTAVNLACGIRRFTNANVLVVDIGPQANCSSRFMPEEFVKMTDYLDQPSLLDVLLGDLPVAECFYTMPLDPELGEESETIDVLPAKLDLNSARDQFPRLPRKEYLLADAFAIYHQEYEPYDYVIIDCPPSPDNFNRNAIVASTHVLVPFMPGLNNLAGISTLQQSIRDANRLQTLNRQPPTKVIGTVLTIVDPNPRVRVTAEARDIINNQTTYPILAEIPRLISVVEAEAARKDMFSYAPNSRATKAYKQLVDNVLEVLGNA